MSAAEVLETELIDTIALNALATGLGNRLGREVDGGVLRLAIRALRVLPEEQRMRIIQREFDNALRDVNAKTRREAESERYRRRARRENVDG